MTSVDLRVAANYNEMSWPSLRPESVSPDVTARWRLRPNRVVARKPNYTIESNCSAGNKFRLPAWAWLAVTRRHATIVDMWETRSDVSESRNEEYCSGLKVNERELTAALRTDISSLQRLDNAQYIHRESLFFLYSQQTTLWRFCMSVGLQRLRPRLWK